MTQYTNSEAFVLQIHSKQQRLEGQHKLGTIWLQKTAEPDISHLISQQTTTTPTTNHSFSNTLNSTTPSFLSPSAPAFNPSASAYQSQPLFAPPTSVSPANANSSIPTLSNFITGLFGPSGSKYLNIFTSAEIDMSTLMMMKDSHLKELGLALGPRIKILEGIKAINKQPQPTQSTQHFNSQPSFQTPPQTTTVSFV